ncbi:9411_t:CDS:2 [Ambispora leptoticha]|uniref:9411_t:CDS:1 n=1 Tax=Ambispora leptoticha TaxID=144679 RepID=A0A9N9BJR1_9GLOM|nr:9411_t:CDS:2 [Ambispora leptoticha]
MGLQQIPRHGGKRGRQAKQGGTSGMVRAPPISDKIQSKRDSAPFMKR